MRALRLAQVAAQAEGLRLRYTARRMAVRVGLLVVALGFLVLAIGFAHLAAWLSLQPVYGASRTAIGLTLADAVIAVCLGLLAARSRPDRLEIEARLVSREAWRGMQRSLDIWTLIVPIAQIFAAARARRSNGEADPS